MTARRRGRRHEMRGAEAEPAGPRRYGLALTAVFLAIGVLLLVLSALGRGWPFLLGALDFLAIGGVLYWVSRERG